MDFLRYIAENIDKYELLHKEKPVIVAVSGGADSVALLVALHRLGYECVAAHCNYHLRGEESNRDMRSVQALCSRLGIDLYVRDFDVEVRRHATGESVEMACRELRYDWFADLLDRQRAQAIAVAHHREDNVETFFLNLMRGSGIGGLTGMRWRNGYVIRPMLDAKRSDIEAFLLEEEIAFVNDSTNAQNDYARNKLRNIVIPALVESFPNAVDGILASISHLSDNRDLYDSAVENKRKSYQDGNVIDLSSMIRQEKCHRILLFEILRPLGFNMSHIDNIIASHRRSGLSFTAGSTTLELDRGKLHISGHARLSANVAETEVFLCRDILAPVNILVSEHSVAEFKPERDARVAYFDKEVLSGDPVFTIRRWQRGDRMTPYGMAKDKLLSDIYADAKYSASDKRNAWLLTRNGEILWAIGLRASSKFSIKPETRRFIKLFIKN